MSKRQRKTVLTHNVVKLSAIQSNILYKHKLGLNSIDPVRSQIQIQIQTNIFIPRREINLQFTQSIHMT